MSWAARLRADLANLSWEEGSSETVLPDLYDILRDFEPSDEDAETAIEILLDFAEVNAGDHFGNPGPIVRFLEREALGYAAAVESLQRAPSCVSLSVVIRGLDSSHGEVLRERAIGVLGALYQGRLSAPRAVVDEVERFVADRAERHMGA